MCVKSSTVERTRAQASTLHFNSYSTFYCVHIMWLLWFLVLLSEKLGKILLKIKGKAFEVPGYLIKVGYYYISIYVYLLCYGI